MNAKTAGIALDLGICVIVIYCLFVTGLWFGRDDPNPPENPAPSPPRLEPEARRAIERNARRITVAE